MVSIKFINILYVYTAYENKKYKKLTVNKNYCKIVHQILQ